MQIVIDILEERYKWIANRVEENKNEPTHLPMEYELIANGIPRETVTEFADRCRECGREKVLDKIRAEIEALNPVDYVFMSGHRGASDMKDDVLEIIDKYKAESEEK